MGQQIQNTKKKRKRKIFNDMETSTDTINGINGCLVFLRPASGIAGSVTFSKIEGPGGTSASLRYSYISRSYSRQLTSLHQSISGQLVAEITPSSLITPSISSRSSSINIKKDICQVFVSGSVF